MRGLEPNLHLAFGRGGLGGMVVVFGVEADQHISLRRLSNTVEAVPRPSARIRRRRYPELLAYGSRQARTDLHYATVQPPCELARAVPLGSRRLRRRR